MKPRLTLFTATLVQDSALSVSGLDRESSADQPFTIVDGTPTLAGRALKGAAVAMAKRFFEPLPRAVTDDVAHGPLRRSAWEFADATAMATPHLRAGVGIRQKTGARASRVLYDREVIPAGTTWTLNFRVDRSFALDDDEFAEAEGILGYVLAEHWAKGRCWLGGDVARGLGWCHIENLKAYRFDKTSYEEWVKAGRPRVPGIAPVPVPTVTPTRSWCFRTLDVDISFGEYQPNPCEPAWGLDMFAVGPHATERAFQPTGDGIWARPAWAANAKKPDALSTDRALLMEAGRPVLPGASVRGPLRHSFSRLERAAGREVKDPHLFQGNVGEDDPAGRAFGTVSKSSRILIRDARAEGEWYAARLHMHAEDEFSAGSYGSAKRDAVRVLKARFPVRIVVEGPTPEAVEPLMALLDRQIALGRLGHLPVGGHKTRGAGWGGWQAKEWKVDDIIKARDWMPSEETPTTSEPPPPDRRTGPFSQPLASNKAWVRTQTGTLSEELTLGAAARAAKAVLGERLVAWWCDPTIDLTLTQAPAIFGRAWPAEDDRLQIDEVAFYAEKAVWRAARTPDGVRFVLIQEIASQEEGGLPVEVVHTPARLHGFQRFSSANTGRGAVLLRQWHEAAGLLGFTICKVSEEES